MTGCAAYSQLPVSPNRAGGVYLSDDGNPAARKRNQESASVSAGSLPPGEVASEPVVELARPAAAGLMSAAQAAVRLSGGDWGTMIWTTKVKGALLCLRLAPHSRLSASLHAALLEPR